MTTRKQRKQKQVRPAETELAPPREIDLGAPRTSEGAVRRGGYYIAYGSNLLPRQMARRVDGAVPVERVLVRDRRLAFGGGNNVATLERCKDAKAAGVIWRMPEKAFEAMNGFEGVPAKYRRKRVSVRGYNDLPVYTYLLRDGATAGAKPYKEYYGRVLGGLVQWGFDKQAGKLRKRGWMAPPRPKLRDSWWKESYERGAITPPRAQVGIWPGDNKSYDFEDLGDGLDFADGAQLMEEPDMFTDFQVDGDQPFANYRSLLEVRAEGSVEGVLAEYAAMQDRAAAIGGALEPFIGFFYGIFVSPRTRREYGLGKEFAAAKLINMQRVSNFAPAATRYCPGAKVNGVLCAVPSESVAALDRIEGAPEWYRRERVQIVSRAGGGRYTKAWAGAQFYQMNRFDIGQASDLTSGF